MAKMDITAPTSFEDAIIRLAGNAPRVLDKACEAGAEVLEKEVRKKLSSAIGSNNVRESESTGQLLKALGTTPAKTDKSGVHNAKVGFAENRRDGVSNAKIATVLEYGGVHQKPRAFFAPAKKSAKKKVIDTMQKVLEEGLK